MNGFVSGTEFNAGFYRSVVAPLVTVEHAAAQLGYGSDVLGYDTERSTDHGWGPRLQVFVDPSKVDEVRAALDEGLPETFQGWPVRYGWDDVGVRHHVAVVPWREFLRAELGVDPAGGLGAIDWLLIPQQQLLGVVRGAVYADPSGELAATRDQLGYFPDDVWRWMLGCQWLRLSQEEAFAGRTSEVGDELGSRLVAARLARELMRLVFLLERTYWPYTKWLGTAFATLPIADTLAPALMATVAATDYPAREAALSKAYEMLARKHNALGLTEALDPSVRDYYSRPFRVLRCERFAEATFAALGDSGLRSLPPVGSVDQFVDSTDVLSRADRALRLRALYEPAAR